MIEDSRAIVEYVRVALATHVEIEMLPAASDGQAGVQAAVQLEPDVILMDLELPKLHGLDAIRQIMAIRPCPIVVLSAHAKDATMAFEALRAGALDIMLKPDGIDPAHVAFFRARLLTLLNAALVARPPSTVPPPRPHRSTDPGGRTIAALGSSTGGLPVLHEILTALPRPFSLPLVIAHHIMVGFDDGLRSWLERTGHQVEKPTQGSLPQAGVVYVTPAGHDLELQGGRFCITASPAEASSPSIDRLFRSLAEEYPGKVAAFLLSGMGEDGVDGMAELHAGGSLTVVQAPATCVVAGMVDAAIGRGVAQVQLDPGGCAVLLRKVGEQAS